MSIHRRNYLANELLRVPWLRGAGSGVVCFAVENHKGELLATAKNGTLLAEERVEIDNDERVGHMLSLMKSKARRSLKDGQGKGTAEEH